MAFDSLDFNVLIAATVILTAFVAFWRWRRSKFNIFKTRGIQGPEPSFLSGNFYEFWNKDTIKVMDRWSKTYGDIYGMYNGDVPFLMVKDLELLRRVFVTDFAMFMDRGDVWATMNGNSELRNTLPFAKSDRWKFLRRAVSIAFTASKMRRMTDGMSKAVDHFLDLLDDRCRKSAGGEVNVYPMLGTLAFEMVADTACGLHLNVQDKPDDQYFDSANSYLLNVIESAYQRTGQFFSGTKILMWLTCQLERHFGREPHTCLTRKAQPIITLREKEPHLARADVLQSLLDAKIPKELLSRPEFRVRANSEGHFLMPLKDVSSNAAAVLTAGLESVAVACANCVFCLAKYPEVQVKVRQEVNAAHDKHGGFTYDAIKDMPYTRQVINETLRLYSPVIAFATRKASCDFRYKDISLPKAINIMACTQQIHRDPCYWDRPEEFNPDRFSSQEKAKRHPLAFQPFGMGARNCVGSRLALLEVTLIVARLVHRYLLHLGSRHANGELKRKTQSIVAPPEEGVWIRVEKIL